MRNNILFLFLILTIFSSCSIEKSQVKILNTTEEIIHDKIIVAFGDSLTYGYGIDREYSYPSQLQKELDELEYNIKVYNSGLSGETTTAALNRVEWVLQLNPDIVILTIGGNDAIRGIDIEITKSNIEKIINIFNNNNVTIILSGMEIYENMGEQYVSEFKQIYFDIAKVMNIMLRSK